MDPMGLAGMLFVLLMVAMVGGFVLLLPISRRLGAYLEQRLSDGRAAAPPPDERLTDLREAVLGLQAQIDRLAERQEFTERLLAEPPETVRLSGGAARAADN